MRDERSPAKDLIFLHGAGHGSWCWTHLVAELSAAPQFFNRLIALDMPGCGQKRKSANDKETLRSLVQGLNDELKALKVHKAVLIGHSIAGLLLPMMAAESPSLFSSLVYLQAAAPQEGQSMEDQVGRRLQGEDPERVGRPFGSDNMPETVMMTAILGLDLNREQLRWLLGEGRQDKTPPALMHEPITRKGYDPRQFAPAYVLAKRDPIVPRDWQRRFAERLGCKQIVEIDTGHEAFISHPKLLADTLRTLVERRPGVD